MRGARLLSVEYTIKGYLKATLIITVDSYRGGSSHISLYTQET